MTIRSVLLNEGGGIGYALSFTANRMAIGQQILRLLEGQGLLPQDGVRIATTSSSIASWPSFSPSCLRAFCVCRTGTNVLSSVLVIASSA